MSEQLGALDGAPTPELERLYARWARGGLGLSITGNVMIDRRSIGEPRNVGVEDDRDRAGLERWAAAASTGGTTAMPKRAGSWWSRGSPGCSSTGPTGT